MKLIFLFLIISLIQVTASTKAQTITLNKQNISITAVFEEIMMQSDYDFSYSEQQISKVSKINISVTNASINEVLDKCFQDQPLTYSIKGKNVIIVARKSSLLQRLVDKFNYIDVQGTIVNETGSSLVGATVKVKGSKISVRTDSQGRFSILNIAKNTMLVISYIGYQTKEIPASTNVGTIKLEPSSGELQEIEINAGYYTVKDRERTGSITRVSSETISKQPVSNVLGALIGRMPGVNIQQLSGINGGGFNVEIRGRNSLRTEGRQPLYLLNGVPYPANPITNSFLNVEGISNFSSPLNYISPSDIESIEVLKDADATAIYGSRGANGVVLITTKKAKSGNTSVNINAYSGISKISNKLDLLNTRQYLEMRNEAFKNDGVNPGATDYDLNGTWDQNRYTNWQDELTGGTANTFNIQAAISGGTDATQFSFRTNYNRQSAVTPGNFKDQKGSGSLTVNHSSTNKKLMVTLTSGYGLYDNNLPLLDMARYSFLAPNAPALYDENGNLNWAQNADGAPTWENPVSALLNQYNGDTNTFTSNGSVSYQILPDLFIRSNLGYTNIQMTERLLSPISSKPPMTDATGNHQSGINKSNSWILEPQVTYTTDLGPGIMNALLGTTFQSDHQRNDYHLGYGYTSDLLLGSIGLAPVQTISSTSSQYKYNAVYGRLNYKLLDKYIVNLTGRRDGSSRFGPDKQFGNFGAVGLAWIFTNENLIVKHLPMLNFGKLRISYGITGSDQIPNYGYVDTYSATPSKYLDKSGLFPARLANPNYSWEINKKLEAALDLGFLKDRILINAAWYLNRSSNQLVGYSLPAITGFTTIQYNLPATVQNSGWEFEINTINISKTKFSWKSSINLTLPKNRLLSYPNIEGSSYANIYTVGKSLYTPRGYHYLGVDPQTGIYTFSDLNGNGNDPDAADRLAANKDIASHLFGGLQNNLTISNFQIEIFLQFVNKTSRHPFAFLPSPGTFANQPLEVLNRWKNKGDQTDIQKFSQSNAPNGTLVRSSFMGLSDRFIDASFVRLNNLALTWNAPDPWIRSCKLTSLRFYIQGQNLFTITKYPGDPEIANLSTLPSLTTITAGVQIGL